MPRTDDYILAHSGFGNVSRHSINNRKRGRQALWPFGGKGRTLVSDCWAEVEVKSNFMSNRLLIVLFTNSMRLAQNEQRKFLLGWNFTWPTLRMATNVTLTGKKEKLHED